MQDKVSMTEETKQLLGRLAGDEYKSQSKRLNRAVSDVAAYEDEFGYIDWLKIYALDSSFFGVPRFGAYESSQMSMTLRPDVKDSFKDLYREVQDAFPGLTIRGAYSNVVSRLIVRAWYLIKKGQIEGYKL